MNDPFEHCEIELRLRVPGSGRQYSCPVKLDRDLYERSLAPLPRDREIWWEETAQQISAEQERLRAHLVRCIADNLAAQLMTLVEKQDTVNGYPKE